MDIKDRLRALDALRGRSAAQSYAPAFSERAPGNIESVVNGRTVANDHGSFFYLELDHDPDYRHGVVQLSNLLQRDPALLEIIGLSADLRNIPIDRVLFIDTETTGLAGGSGTYVFLVGVGYFVGETIRVAQFFMNDYDEEGRCSGRVRKRHTVARRACSRTAGF